MNIYTNMDNAVEIIHLLQVFYWGEKFHRIKSKEEADIIVEIETRREEAYVQIRIKSENIEQTSVVKIENPKDKKQLRRKVKREIYGFFVAYKQVKPYWGILTGVRPTKLAYGLYTIHKSKEKVEKELEERYDIAEEKAKLTAEIVEKEWEILEKEKESISIYINIPFCPTRCTYCSFVAYDIKEYSKIVDKYITTLIYELHSVLEVVGEKRISTVYFGGGTPTSLTAEAIQKLLKGVNEILPLKEIKEVTFEAGRPDTITEEKLAILKEYHITRISVNPQTMNEKTLKKMGRKHSVGEVENAFYLARKKGFEQINMDIILGLPGEGYKEVKHTMEKLKEIEPDEITVHSLALKRQAKLFNEEEEIEKVKVKDMQTSYQLVKKSLEEMGMKPYYLYRQKNIVDGLENIGYTKKGVGCIYNMEIIEEIHTILSFGSGGITKIVNENKIHRVENVKNVEQYIERVDEMIERKKYFLLL